MCDLQSATIWCEFRSTGFPCSHSSRDVDEEREQRGEGVAEGAGVLRWWFELTSWPAANLDLMKYERRPAADTNCNSFIKETRFDSKLLKVVWVVLRGGRGSYNVATN